MEGFQEQAGVLLTQGPEGLGRRVGWPQATGRGGARGGPACLHGNHFSALTEGWWTRTQAQHAHRSLVRRCPKSRL